MPFDTAGDSCYLPICSQSNSHSVAETRMEDEDGYEVVIPTAPEDELDSSFNNSAFGQSPEESTPSRPSPVPSFSPALIGPLNPQTINRPPKPRQDPVRPKGPKRDRSSGKKI